MRVRRRYQKWLWSSPTINEPEVTTLLRSWSRGNMGTLANKVLARAVSILNLPFIDLSHGYATNSKWHQGLIIHLASILRPRVYLELGIFKCGLFNRMIPFAEQLIGVDANPEAGTHMAKSPKVRFVASTTSNFARHLRSEPISIDMIFIDADHSREAVEQDFVNFFPFVKPHGLILLHDTHPMDKAATSPERCGDAYQAIESLSRKFEQFEMMTLPWHPGLTLCRKRTAQLAWQER